MKQIFSPFQQYECFRVDGVDYICLDYQIIQFCSTHSVKEIACDPYRWQRSMDAMLEMGLPVPAEEGSRQEENSTPAVAEQLMEKIDVEQKWGNFPNLQDGQVIGVVGRRCRNKWYVEVKVGEEWGKAEIGQWVVHPNDWVIVELAWASADGRDKEWRIVANIDAVPVVAPEPVVVAKLEDFDSGEPEVPTPAEQEHPSAADFMEQARRAAYAAYAR